MIGFIVDTEFVWGFQARIVGLSKTSPSFYYPPPTTFLGALAEVIAKDKRIGESEGKKLIPRLSEKLLAIGFRPINCVPIKYENLNRIIMISRKMSKKLGKNILFPHPKDLDASFDSPARGKTILSSLDNNAPIIRWFLAFKENEITFNDEEISLDKKLFWRIHRLGSKESRVSVTEVLRIDRLEVMRDGTTTTNYSFPVTKFVVIQNTRGVWEYEVYVNPFDIKRYDEKENPIMNYIAGRKILSFKVPILKTTLRFPECRVKLINNAAAYKFGNEVVIGWWR